MLKKEKTQQRIYISSNIFHGKRTYFCVVLLVLAVLLLYNFCTKKCIASRSDKDIPTYNRSQQDNASKPKHDNLKMNTLEISKLLEERLKIPTNLTKVVMNTPCENITSFLACFDKNCTQVISKDPSRRIQDLFSTDKLTLNSSQRDLVLSVGKQIPENDVIIISASSSNHYNEMQAMFQNLHQVVYPRFANFTVVFFDIGLSPQQRSLTEKNCKCLVLSFPTDIFPPHMKDNHCYSWKPIMILAALSKARKYVVYQDASIRWLENFRLMFERTEVYGHQVIRFAEYSRVPAHTLKQTFDYMEDKPCAFLPYTEIVGGLQLHKNDPLTIKAVLEPWARCALEKNCICPVEPMSVLYCRSNIKLHRCHRFDQSAISMIMAKVYGEEMYRFLAPNKGIDEGEHWIIRREQVAPNYFQK